jgi:hypothetical protein
MSGSDPVLHQAPLTQPLIVSPQVLISRLAIFFTLSYSNSTPFNHPTRFHTHAIGMDGTASFQSSNQSVRFHANRDSFRFKLWLFTGVTYNWVCLTIVVHHTLSQKPWHTAVMSLFFIPVRFPRCSRSTIKRIVPNDDRPASLYTCSPFDPGTATERNSDWLNCGASSRVA